MRSNGLGIVVICDNGIYLGGSETSLLWDDTNELLISVKANINPYTQAKAPIEITVTEYEHIQYIQGQFAVDNKLKTALTTFGFKAEDVTKIYESAENLHNFSTKSNKEFDEKSPWQKDL